MTTKADTTVKWFHSGMPGAPVLRGEPGALIEVLDACLINGFSTRSPDSVVVAGGVATVSISAGNPYDKHAVIAISGASEAALNAEWRIATSSASSFTFACPGVASGAVTGATLKRAPAGWAKPFSDTNKAVYQSADPNSTQLFMWIDDTDPQYARMRGYEQMTGVDAGVSPFPTLAQFAKTLQTWCKSNLASTASRNWVVIADGSFMHVHLAFNASYPTLAAPNMFGDIVKILPSDGYSCITAAHGAEAPSFPGTAHPGTIQAPSAGSGRYLARDSSQTGSATHFSLYALSAHSSSFAGHSNAPAPGLAGERHVGPPVLVADGVSSSSKLRGWLPGVRSTLQALPFDHLLVVENPAGGALLALDAAFGSTGTTATTRMLIDITGPWR